MVNYIDLKLKCIAGHTEIVINSQRIKCAAAARREAELKYGFHSNHGTNKAAYVKKR